MTFRGQCDGATFRTTSNGVHVAVILSTDPLTVIPDDITECHTTGRRFASPIVREMLQAMGVRTCPDCHRFTGMAPRTERNLRPKGSGWRER